jgi:hypothetical protein
MTWFETFMEAFRRGARKEAEKQEEDKKELLRSSGGSLGSTPALRPTPEGDSEHGIDSGDVSVGSSDPDEGKGTKAEEGPAP